MGTRGPGKKLPALQRLEGNPSKRRIDDSGIEASGLPFVPEHLGDVARGCLEVIRLSMPAAVYSALDSFTLAAFAQTWATVVRAQHEMSKPGFQPVNDDGEESRWLAIHRKESMVLATLGDRLGLNPKARASIKIPKANQQRQEFDGLIGRPLSSRSVNGCAYQAE